MKNQKNTTYTNMKFFKFAIVITMLSIVNLLFSYLQIIPFSFSFWITFPLGILGIALSAIGIYPVNQFLSGIFIILNVLLSIWPGIVMGLAGLLGV